MLTHFREAVGTWVHAKNAPIADVPLGKIYDMVVNPGSGKVEAFWVKGDGGLKLLSPKNIIHWNQIELLIGEEADLVDPNGMPSLEKILENEVKIIGTPVYGKVYGKYLGKVRNFAFHTVSPVIVSLRVETGWALLVLAGLFHTARLLKLKKMVFGLWTKPWNLRVNPKK